MLDLMKLAQQMQGISRHLNQESVAARKRLERAQALLGRAQAHQAELVDQQQHYRDRLGFTAATPVEPLNTRIDIKIPPPSHSVLATDGSQISPSHHEIAYCYLINVGRVALHYGQSQWGQTRYPQLDSLPEVVYKPEELYVSRQWGIRTEEWMGYCRTVSEAVRLAELACDGGFVGDRAGAGQRDENLDFTSSLAMVDGSLIYWFLDPLPRAARDRILPPILSAWERLKNTAVPLVGYLSASRSGEALNFLRLQSCPFSEPDCLTHCPDRVDNAPCQVFSPLRDTALWQTQLQPGQRGPLWRSSASILDLYGDHRIYFCYVHVGAEIARLEFPAWVAEDADMLNLAVSLTLAQVQKGYGYPVALAEAHNQAVVRGGDRIRFFSLLEQEMIRAGLRNVGTSYKEARKRGSIA